MSKITPKELTDKGICPTCYDKEHGNIVYGHNSDKILYEDGDFECFLCGNPRTVGHTIISSKKHYKDMMEVPDDLCSMMFCFSKEIMKNLKEVYKSESVYLCTMCDGPMNHFHIQLIPRYKEEERGSKNFVKSRQEFVLETDKIECIRSKINTIMKEG